jgi:hypothetical protein
MHASTTEATRLSAPIVGVTRWDGKRRRLYVRLRHFARALASRMSDGQRGGLLEALHESRSLLAGRLIHQHRHLIQDERCIDALHCAGDAAVEARQS